MLAITVDIISHGRKVKAARGRLLSEVLSEAGLPLGSYCRGRGVCGKCFVQIIEGRRPDLKENEERLLARRGLDSTHRLACLYEIQGPLRISIPAVSVLEKMPVLAWGAEVAAPLDPAVKKYALELPPPDLAQPRASWDLVRSSLKLPRLGASLDVIRSLPAVLAKAHGRLTAVLHQDAEVLGFEAEDTTAVAFGLAVDLGTTTLVVDLVDLNTGRVVDSETALNSQAAYGADVVSRISLVYAEPTKAEVLRRAVLKDLNRMTAALLARQGLSPDVVYEAVVAGNTAMNHLLLAAPVSSLALAPFNPVYSAIPVLGAAEVGLQVRDNGRVYLAPNIKSFVGGDIAAGLMASGFFDGPGPELYIDLGTNGEIALKCSDRVMVTSTAAGPAFEGMNISQGMLAVPGAIYRAEEDGGLKVFTVGDQPARGICGTGLIDLVAVFCGQNFISPGGAITRPDKRLPVAEGLSLDQKDVRELQLAAAAVKSGIRMMLAAAGLRASDLKRLFIAGAFGNYLNIARTMRLGLLPSIDPKRIVFLGNASLAGARLLLLSLETRRRLESSLADIAHFSLAAQPGFQDTFIGSLEFAPWS